MEPITLKVSDNNVETSPQGMAIKAFAAEIEEKTEGKVTFEFFWTSSLLPPTEGLSGIESGLVDIEQSAVAYFPDELPVASWFGKVGAANQSDAWPLGLMQANLAMIEQWQTNKDLRAEFANHGAIPLFPFASLKADMLCTKPVSTLEEAKGTVFRTPGSPWSEEAEAMGMTNVSLSFPELFEGLQRGVMDCVNGTPRASFTSNGLWDVAKYYTPLGMSGSAGQFYLISQDTWDGLPAKVQDVFTEAKATFSTVLMTEELKGYTAFAKGATEKGIQFLDGSELRGVINDHREEVRKGLVANAPAGVSDPQGAYDAYVASLEESLAAAEKDFGIPASPLAGGQQEIVDAYLAVEGLDWEPFNQRLLDKVR
jgi:TRAP-type C4-dicarboxylate transport system substrate-binding protein